MPEPLDRFRRDSALFQFTEKRLRDFVGPGHLLIQIDERLNFSSWPLNSKIFTAATLAVPQGTRLQRLATAIETLPPGP